MSRFTLKLTQANRRTALAWIDRAIERGREEGRAWSMELREAKRTDDQNRALWSLLHQIHKQRPTHNGVEMTPDLWKAVFLDAWGAETVFLPKLEGGGMFAAGHRSSQLTKAEFAELLTVILAWCAHQGLEIEHFDQAEAA